MTAERDALIDRDKEHGYTPPRFDLIVVDKGARTFPATPGSVKLAAGWIAFLPAIGEEGTRHQITLPTHRVHEVLHNRLMPPQDEPTSGRDFPHSH